VLADENKRLKAELGETRDRADQMRERLEKQCAGSSVGDMDHWRLKAMVGLRYICLRFVSSIRPSRNWKNVALTSRPKVTRRARSWS